jgi:hypothetical protein
MVVSRSCDVLVVHQNQAFLDTAFADGSFHFRRAVDKPAAGGEVEPEFLAVGFHEVSLGIDGIFSNLLYSTRMKKK